MIEELKELEDLAAREEEMIPKLGIDLFVEGRKNLIRRFSIARLAQILFERVTCFDEPRNLTDWFTAEEFFDNHFTPKMKRDLGCRDLILRAYDYLGVEELPLASGDIICPFSLDKMGKKYVDAIEYLLKLSEENRIELFSRAASSNEGMYIYIGRLIWEWGYQRIKPRLPRPPYGCILYA